MTRHGTAQNEILVSAEKKMHFKSEMHYFSAFDFSQLGHYERGNCINER